MFSKKANENDLWVEMDRNLKKNALDKSSQYEVYKLKALTILASAVQELDDLGLHSEASGFMDTLERAERDPVTKVAPDQSEISDDKIWDKTSDSNIPKEGLDVPKEQIDQILEISEDGNKDSALCESDLKQLQNIWK